MPLSDKLGDALITQGGHKKPTADVLKGKEFVVLYFSASWCPPCQRFTPMLAEFYKAHSQAKKFEIVFVSADRDEASADAYFNEKMPWAMVPYSAAQREKLAGEYAGAGIPDLCILTNPRGDVVTKGAVEKLVNDPGAKKFPWPDSNYVAFAGAGRSLGGPKAGDAKKSAEFNTGNGQAVVYADADPTPENDFISQARAAGAVSAHEDREAQEKKFSGAGRRLGADVGGEPLPPPKVDGVTEVNVKITVWKDGITIDDDDVLLPQDAPEVSDIKQGRVPKRILAKLREDHKGQKRLPEVVFSIEDRQGEAYKKSFKAFAGGGHSLASSAPSAAAPAPPAPESNALPSAVDETKETTKIQITMPGGDRIPGTFNLDHTVADVYAFARHAKAGLPAFTLMTTFPRAELTDHTKTIKAAGLARAVVVVKPL